MTNQPLLRALRGDTVLPPPVWLMRQAGRYLPEYRALRKKARNFLHFCYTPELAVEATLQPVKRFGLDAAILFSDILTVPDALGVEMAFKEGEGPVLQPVDPERDLDRLDASALCEKLAPVYQAAAEVKRALAPETALIGFAGAPWTVAAYMLEGRTSRDYLVARRAMARSPDAFVGLIDLLVRATVDHLSAQIEAGADVVQLFESWSSVLNPAARRRWSIDPIEKIIQGVRAAHPDAPIIVFPRGAGVQIVDYAEAEPDGVGIDTATPLDRTGLPNDMCLQGNLDPAILIEGGEALKAATLAMVARMRGRPYIANLGHGVDLNTPPDHVAAFVDHVRHAGELSGDIGG
jgi:uroporphyrinogen decarboxylase